MLEQVDLSFTQGYTGAVDGDLSTFGNFGNVPGNVTATFAFPNANPLRIFRIGIKWGDYNGGSFQPTAGDGLRLSLGGDPADPEAVPTPLPDGLLPSGDLVYREVDLPTPIIGWSLLLTKLYNVEPIDASVFELTAFSGPFCDTPAAPTLAAEGLLLNNLPVIRLTGNS